MAAADEGDTTFLRVTNHDIYQKLLDIDVKVSAVMARERQNSLQIRGLWAATGVMITVLIFLLQVKP